MIDVKGVIKSYGLDENGVAEELFPGNKYAKSALRRVMRGDAELNASQLKRLSELAGIEVGELYNINGRWSARSSHGVVTLISRDYRVELDLKTWVSKIFKNDNLLAEEVLSNQMVSVKEFINQIENKVKNYEGKN